MVVHVSLQSLDCGSSDRGQSCMILHSTDNAMTNFIVLDRMQLFPSMDRTSKGHEARGISVAISI